MGRDLTPKDSHILDKHYHFANEKLALTDLATGEETVLYDPASEYAMKWPTAYYLAAHIVEKLSGTPTALDMFENILCQIIAADDNHKPLDFGDNELADKIVKWYNGELDPNFYYSTRNDEMLLEILSKLDISF